jgi:hypothetical protein
MAHEGDNHYRSIEDEGKYFFVLFFNHLFANIPRAYVVACNVGDWVQVECDYSPGIFSEGGTGVVIAKNEGRIVNYYYPTASDVLNCLNARSCDREVHIWPGNRSVSERCCHRILYFGTL